MRRGKLEQEQKVSQLQEAECDSQKAEIETLRESLEDAKESFAREKALLVADLLTAQEEKALCEAATEETKEYLAEVTRHQPPCHLIQFNNQSRMLACR